MKKRKIREQRSETNQLIEQQDSVYSYGSSFGESRISRSLGSKNNIFSYLQQTSVAETQKLIAFLNEANNSGLHKMEDIYTTSPITYIYYDSQRKVVDELLDGQTDKYEYAANANEALAMFNMNIPDSVMVIREYKKYTGTLNPKVLISKLHQGIKYKGSKILYNEQVTSLQRRDNGRFEIQTKNTKTGAVNTIISETVVSAAGAYTGSLLKNVAPYVEQLITPQRLFLAYFKINKNRMNGYSVEQKKRLKDYYPMADWNAEIFYSMIEKYDADEIPIIKIGGHTLRTDIENLEEVWQKKLTEKEIEWSRSNTLNYFNMLNIPIDVSDLIFYKGYSCVYSLTKTEIPYVTNILDDNNKLDSSFVLVGGMSGVGAKGSLAYGLIAANLILNKEDSTMIYQKTKEALGFERLLEDYHRLGITD